MGFESRHGLVGPFVLGTLRKQPSRYQLRPESSSTGQDSFPSSCNSCQQDSVPRGLLDEGLNLLLTVDQRLPLLYFLPSVPLYQNPEKQCQWDRSQSFVIWSQMWCPITWAILCSSEASHSVRLTFKGVGDYTRVWQPGGRDPVELFRSLPIILSFINSVVLYILMYTSLKTPAMGWIVRPPHSCVEVLIPVPQTVAIFGDRLF